MPGVNIVLKGTQKEPAAMEQVAMPLRLMTLILYWSFHLWDMMLWKYPWVIETWWTVMMNPGAENTKEVVVTALGIQREERSLGYSVGKVDSKELNRVAQENVLNAMAGKVAGVSISSTGGTGSSVSMVIRGATSLSSDNQPLFVVDGVPLANTLNNISQVGNDNRADFGNSIPVSTLMTLKVFLS